MRDHNRELIEQAIENDAGYAIAAAILELADAANNIAEALRAAAVHLKGEQ